MSSIQPQRAAQRILLIDDDPAIHTVLPRALKRIEEDIGRLRSSRAIDHAPELGGDGSTDTGPYMPQWLLDGAYQGKQGLELVEQAAERGQRYAVAIVDMRMPPGWNGLETIEHLWAVDPDIQIIICTARLEHSHAEIIDRLDPGDNLLILRKPFGATQLIQMIWSMSHKWQLNQVLSKRLRNLDLLVEKRTAELETTNDKLRFEMDERKRVQSELIQASKQRAIGVLAAGVAHEINTPLQYICDNVSFSADMGLTLLAGLRDLSNSANETLPDTHPLRRKVMALLDTLDLEWVSDELPSACTQSIEGLGKVHRVVRALMDFSGEDKPPGFARVCVSEAVTCTLAVGRQHWEGKAVITTKIEEAPMVWAIARDLNQVVLELISNAIQALEGCPPAESRIQIVVRRRDEVVELEVSDNGPGVDEDDRDRIFDPFFSTRDVGSGTGGIGLSACRSIVTKHAGTLTYAPIPGEAGARFVVELPISPHPARLGAAPTESPPLELHG